MTDTATQAEEVADLEAENEKLFAENGRLMSMLNAIDCLARQALDPPERLDEELDPPERLDLE